MRAFLASCLAIIIIAVGAVLLLNTVQRTAAAAYSTDGARVDPRWTLRRIMKREAPAPGQTVAIQHGGQGTDSTCELASALAWLFVDFGDASNDNPGCK
jgi:hypothetical protein